MNEKQQTYNVANNMKLTLPALNEEQIAIATKEEWVDFIRHRIHNPNHMGWPDAVEEYHQMGLMLQALNERTARVVLVVDDEFARSNLAIYAAAYAHWGFELLIDTATFVRTGVTRVPKETIESKVQARETHHTPDALGMEVA